MIENKLLILLNILIHDSSLLNLLFYAFKFHSSKSSNNKKSQEHYNLSNLLDFNSSRKVYAFNLIKLSFMTLKIKFMMSIQSPKLTT